MLSHTNLTPAEIVFELDKFIVGQNAAKRSVAIALRNRWRRQQIVGEMQNEIIPNNIILIGPTGVGKTEIARRLSKLANAPFIKVEASKFTEVGYVGRDVESMVRELMHIAVNQIRLQMMDEVAETAKENAIGKILDILVQTRKRTAGRGRRWCCRFAPLSQNQGKMRSKLLAGDLDEREIEFKTTASPCPTWRSCPT